MESLFLDNNSLLFVAVLFCTVISGRLLSERSRIILVYSLSLFVLAFQIVGIFPVVVGSFVVTFLLLEIFNDDEELLRTFSVKYKLVDYIYKMLFVYSAFLYCLSIGLLILLQNLTNDILFIEVVGAVLVVLLSLFVSKAPFSFKSINEIVSILHERCSLWDFDTFNENEQKYEILAYMEDKGYFSRGVYEHSWTLRQMAAGIKKVVKNSYKRVFKMNSERLDIDNYIRGYGTIEMQLIRTVGIEFGSYSHVVRRKIFEVLYSNMILNGYLRKYGSTQEIRDSYKRWIMQCYIESVPVKFSRYSIQPDGQGTFKRVFGKLPSKGSNEEFFVWCLGLPHYTNGVGEKAVLMRQDVINHFDLDLHAIWNAIAVATAQNHLRAPLISNVRFGLVLPRRIAIDADLGYEEAVALEREEAFRIIKAKQDWLHGWVNSCELIFCAENPSADCVLRIVDFDVEVDRLQESCLASYLEIPQGAPTSSGLERFVVRIDNEGAVGAYQHYKVRNEEVILLDDSDYFSLSDLSIPPLEHLQINISIVSLFVPVEVKRVSVVYSAGDDAGKIEVPLQNPVRIYPLKDIFQSRRYKNTYRMDPPILCLEDETNQKCDYVYKGRWDEYGK